MKKNYLVLYVKVAWFLENLLRQIHIAFQRLINTTKVVKYGTGRKMSSCSKSLNSTSLIDLLCWMRILFVLYLLIALK